MTDTNPDRAAKFYTALLHCEYCDRSPLEHRWDDEENVYRCTDDPAEWVSSQTMTAEPVKGLPPSA